MTNPPSSLANCENLGTSDDINDNIKVKGRSDLHGVGAGEPEINAAITKDPKGLLKNIGG